MFPLESGKDNARGMFASTPLPYEDSAVAEELHPRTIFAPFCRVPRVLAGAEHAFRVRHHYEGAAVFRAEAVDAKRRTVRVERITFGVFVLAIHIAQRHKTSL